MPLLVPCPGCPAQLSAPESAAGKHIRCPKCKAVAAVPALIPAQEVAVVEAKVAAPQQPKPKPVVASADDEDDRPRRRSRRDDEADAADDRPPRRKRRPLADEDDEDEPPRPRRRKRAADGGGTATALIVAGVLVLLIGGAVGVYFLTGKGGLFARKAPVPAGWKQYSYPDDGFKAYFPSPPETLLNAHNPTGFGRRAAGPWFAGAPEPQDVESVSVHTCGDGLFTGRPPGGVGVTVVVARYRNGTPRGAREDVTRIGSTKFGNMEARRVRWLGHDAGEVVIGNTVMRVVYTDTAQITVQLHGANGTRAKPEEENGFFDNFELTK